MNKFNHWINSSPFYKVWFYPLIISILCAIGLTTALFDHSWWAISLSWIGLGLPVYYCCRFWWFKTWFERKI